MHTILLVPTPREKLKQPSCDSLGRKITFGSWRNKSIGTQSCPSHDISGLFPDMTCIKRVHRDKKETFHLSAARTKERFLSRWFRYFVVLHRISFFFVFRQKRLSDISSMPWRGRWTFVSWADNSVATRSCPISPGRFVGRPDLPLVHPSFSCSCLAWKGFTETNGLGTLVNSPLVNSQQRSTLPVPVITADKPVKNQSSTWHFVPLAVYIGFFVIWWFRKKDSEQLFTVCRNARGAVGTLFCPASPRPAGCPAPCRPGQKVLSSGFWIDRSIQQVD